MLQSLRLYPAGQHCAVLGRKSLRLFIPPGPDSNVFHHSIPHAAHTPQPRRRYLAPDLRRRGLGRVLLAELLARCEAAGIRKVMAIAGSVGVHLALGFRQVGIVESCGWKFGAWRDIVIMQKTLGPGGTEPPPEPSAS